MKAKKITVLAAVGVLLYSLIVYPLQLASGTQTMFGWFAVGVESVITFIRTVFA